MSQSAAAAAAPQEFVRNLIATHVSSTFQQLPHYRKDAQNDVYTTVVNKDNSTLVWRAMQSLQPGIKVVHQPGPGLAKENKQNVMIAGGGGSIPLKASPPRVQAGCSSHYYLQTNRSLPLSLCL